jgi:hypothetical protein
MNSLHHIRSLLANPYEPENMRALIDVYWRVLLGTAVVFTAGIFAYGAWELMFVMEDAPITHPRTSTSTSTTLPIDSNRIDKILSAFRARQDQFESLKTSSIPIADPSR